MFCTGTFQRSMDGKQRILLPKPVRQFLLGADGLFLTPGTEGCLELHNEASLQQLAADFQQSQATYQSKSTFSRIFFAQSQRCQMDAHDRLRVPAGLSEFAGLASPIVLVGVGSHWEIWGGSRWEEYLVSHQANFDHHARLVRGGTSGQETELKLPRHAK